MSDFRQKLEGIRSRESTPIPLRNVFLYSLLDLLQSIEDTEDTFSTLT